MCAEANIPATVPTEDKTCALTLFSTSTIFISLNTIGIATLSNFRKELNFMKAVRAKMSAEN